MLMVIAALGTVLAAGYLLWLYQRTAFGEPNPEFVSHGAGPAHSLSAAANDDHASRTTTTATTSTTSRWSSGSPGRRS